MVQRKVLGPQRRGTDSQLGEHQEGFLEAASLVGLEGGQAGMGKWTSFQGS